MWHTRILWLFGPFIDTLECCLKTTNHIVMPPHATSWSAYDFENLIIQIDMRRICKFGYILRSNCVQRLLPTKRVRIQMVCFLLVTNQVKNWELFFCVCVCARVCFLFSRTKHKCEKIRERKAHQNNLKWELFGWHCQCWSLCIFSSSVIDEYLLVWFNMHTVVYVYFVWNDRTRSPSWTQLKVKTLHNAHKQIQIETQRNCN